MELMFDQVDPITYIVRDSNEVVNFVNKVAEELSLGDIKLYEDILNNDLKDKLAARVISAIFNKKFPDIFSEKIMYVTIKLTYEGRELVISVGKANIDEKPKLLCGVLYK